MQGVIFPIWTAKINPRESTGDLNRKVYFTFIHVYVHKNEYLWMLEMVSDSLDLGLQEVVGSLSWVLGTWHRSFVRTANYLHCWTITPACTIFKHFKLHFYSLFCVLWCLCGDQRKTFRSLFSPSNIGLLGPNSDCWTVQVSIYWATLLTQELKFSRSMDVFMWKD